jgi:hypothetical protein
MRIQIVNRGPEPAPITVLPTIWFRNTWSWGLDVRRPRMRKGESTSSVSIVEFDHEYYGPRRLLCEGGRICCSPKMKRIPGVFTAMWTAHDM